MRRITLSAISDLERLGFDEVIDVRSPAEWAEDHVPGAVNLPALDNDERAEVGTIYVQQSRFLARRVGAAKVARNVARHLEGYLADKPATYKPLVYCWRGGQRSGSVALILGQIGWQVGVIEGGWKSWRRLVVAQLYDRPFPAPVIVLDGDTGTAKTAILQRVAAMGGQAIDLEGLARHRGSIFGLAEGADQPAQKGFESALAQAVARLDPARPVLIEAESARIGSLRLPPALWQAMRAAPRLVIEAPLEARAGWLARAYADLTADREALARRIAGLAPFHPRARIGEWQAMAGAGAFEALAAALMAEHYDPRYRRVRAEVPVGCETVLRTERLDDEAQARLAGAIVARMG